MKDGILGHELDFGLGIWDLGVARHAALSLREASSNFPRQNKGLLREHAYSRVMHAVQHTTHEGVTGYGAEMRA